MFLWYHVKVTVSAGSCLDEAKQTYGDISSHKRLHRCTWLWGCAPAGKMWGCTQTAEGTGSHMLRCRWNWCKPVESTQKQSAEGWQQPDFQWSKLYRGKAKGGDFLTQVAARQEYCSSISFLRLMAWSCSRPLVSSNSKWEKNWSHWSTAMM